MTKFPTSHHNNPLTPVQKKGVTIHTELPHPTTVSEAKTKFLQTGDSSLCSVITDGAMTKPFNGDVKDVVSALYELQMKSRVGVYKKEIFQCITLLLSNLNSVETLIDVSTNGAPAVVVDDNTEMLTLLRTEVENLKTTGPEPTTTLSQRRQNINYSNQTYPTILNSRPITIVVDDYFNMVKILFVTSIPHVFQYISASAMSVNTVVVDEMESLAAGVASMTLETGRFDNNNVNNQHKWTGKIGFAMNKMYVLLKKVGVGTLTTTTSVANDAIKTVTPDIAVGTVLESYGKIIADESLGIINSYAMDAVSLGIAGIKIVLFTQVTKQLTFVMWDNGTAFINEKYDQGKKYTYEKYNEGKEYVNKKFKETQTNLDKMIKDLKDALQKNATEAKTQVVEYGKELLGVDDLDGLLKTLGWVGTISLLIAIASYIPVNYERIVDGIGRRYKKKQRIK